MLYPRIGALLSCGAVHISVRLREVTLLASRLTGISGTSEV